MATVPLQVPEAARGPLVAIAEASASDLEVVLAQLALLSAPAESAIEELFTDLAGKHDDLQPEEFVQSLLGLAIAITAHNYETEDVAETISRSKQLDLQPEAQGRLEHFVVEFLASEAIRRFAKAIDVMQERDHLVHGLRILSDFRPVFDDEVEAPSLGLILHDLKVTYQGDNGRMEHKTFALDRSDILKLREVADRALEKHDALLEWFETAGVVDLTSIFGEGSDA